MLTWKIYRQARPYRPKHVAFLGSIPVAIVADEGEPFISAGFDLDFSLPPKYWRGDQCDLYLTGFRATYAKLDKAKAAAERIVKKWILDAGLKAPH